MTKTHDLGHGWYANHTKNVAGIETLTIRNPDKGQRIDLGNESIDMLRAIFAEVDRNLSGSSSSECPHCHLGFAPSVIVRHIREKH